MRFIGQFRIPGETLRLAYLFIADEDGLAETWEPFDGHNALLIQPDGRIPAFVDVVPASTGPTLSTRGATWDELVPVELDVELHELDPVQEACLEAVIDHDDNYRRGVLTDVPDVDVGYPSSYIGGRANYWHVLVVPVGGEWDFFFKVEDGEGWDGEPYALNFGGGDGYAFLSPDDREGVFFWQC